MTEKPCPHCDQTPAKERWPFCSWCGLFLIDADRLDLSPNSPIYQWLKSVELVTKLLH